MRAECAGRDTDHRQHRAERKESPFHVFPLLYRSAWDDSNPGSFRTARTKMPDPRLPQSS
jgi:hypothetical protein